METIQCSKCGSVFEKTGAKDKLRRFKDKRFMTTFHCPNCDARVILKNGEEPTTLYLKRLERLKEQARRLGDRQEVNELQEEIDQIHREIKMNAEKTKDKKFFVKSRDAELSKNDPVIKHQIAIAKKTLKMPDAMAGVMGGMTKAEAKEILKKYGVSEDTAYDPTKPKNIAAAKKLSVAQGKAASDEEAYDPLDPENIAKEKELAKARGAAAADAKVEVKQQSDVGSNQWGIYVDGKLVEGGFFSKSAAEEAAVQYNKDSKTTDSLFKGQKVTAIKSEQGLREGETYTVLGEDKIIKQIVGEGDKIVYKLQDSSGNIVVIEDCDDLFYEVKDSLVPVRQNMSSKEVEYKVGGQWKPIEGKVKIAYENEQIKYDRADGGYHYYTCEVNDATNHMGERSFQTYEAWKRACKQIDPNVTFEGDKDICQAKPGIGEWDGATGVIYNKDSKTKDATSAQEEYAEKLFNKLWVELTNAERAEVIRHLDYDLNATAKAKDCNEPLKVKIGNYDSSERVKELEEEIALNIKAGNYNLAEKLKKELEEEKQKETIAQTFGDDDKEDSDATENDPLKVKIGDIRKNMDAAKKMGFDTAPYQKEIDKLKTQDQNVYKSFEISMTSPGRFVAVSGEGEKFEGNLSEVKKAVDDYWTRKEGKVSQSGWPKDSKAKDRKSKDSRDKLIERYKGVDVFFDHTDSLYWAIPKGGVGLNGRSISEIHSKIDQFRDDQNAGDSKVKDAELTVPELKNKALTKVLRDFYEGVKEIYSPASVAGAQKLTQMIESETDPIKLKRWAGLDSKTKDDRSDERKYCSRCKKLVEVEGGLDRQGIYNKCMECGKKFKKNLTSSTFEVKCPNCGGYDVDVISDDAVSNHLPSGLDSMLQDFAQIYGKFNYSDIMNFKPTDAQISRLKQIFNEYQRLGGKNEESDRRGNRYSQEISEMMKTEDSADVYTKDPLTKKGQKILEAMKKIYGEEKGEQIFYASRNKGKISGVDAKTKDGGPGSGIKGHTTAEEPTEKKSAVAKTGEPISSSHQAVREKHGWSASKKESPKELEMRSKEVMAKKSWLNEENREISKQKSQEYKAIKQARQQERINRLYQSSPDKTPIPEDHPYSKLGKTNAGVAAKLAAVVLNNNDDFASHGEGEHNRWGEDQVYEAADFLGLPTRGATMGIIGRKIIAEAKRLVKAEQQ